MPSFNTVFGENASHITNKDSDESVLNSTEEMSVENLTPKT